MDASEGKRKADGDASESNGVEGAKRQRVDGSSSAAVAKPKPAIDLSALAKAKEALQKAKELKERMKGIKALQVRHGSGAAMGGIR